MTRRKRSASRSTFPSHSRNRTSHDNELQNNVNIDEAQVENLNENIHENNDEVVVEDHQNNNENVENENFGFINDNERQIGLEGKEKEDGLVIEPLDTELLPLMNKLNEISVDQLEGEESNKLNLNRVYIDVQLLRLITPSLQQKAMTYGVRCGNNNNQDIHIQQTDVMQSVFRGKVLQWI